jgi:hypothetical protein
VSWVAGDRRAVSLARLYAIGLVLLGCACSDRDPQTASPAAAQTATAPAPYAAAATAPSELTTPSTPVAGRKAMLGEVRLELSTPEGRCVLLTSDSDAPIELELPAPCAFHRTQDGALRTMAARGKTIALVESSAPNPELGAGSCKTQVRGIVLDSGAISRSPHKSLVAACPPVAWDDAMFFGLFD